MRERPILFSGPMVRAILDGRKTQTRRMIKQAAGPSLSVDMDDDAGVAELSWLHGDGPGHEVHEAIKRVPCPYGQPGDRLWVRETWRAWATNGAGDHVRTQYRADDAVIDRHIPGEWSVAKSVARGAWGPSILMPRWASRLSLEVVGVRVERLQDISEADAQAEGVEPIGSLVDDDYWRCYLPRCECGGVLSARRSFETLWHAINGRESWDANPWVWVVEFAPIDAAVRAQFGGGR